MSTFKELDPALQRALEKIGYETPTPIQAQVIPHLIEGRDVLGCAQTGTGKTAAFCLPILHRLLAEKHSGGPRKISALILTPTRELAAQIGENLQEYSRFTKIKQLVIFGGVNENPQKAALRRGIDILVATPGRLLDLHNQKCIDLSQVKYFVLDEADRMLDMGFIHDVKRVLKALPDKKQSLLFSATMPKSIEGLASGFLHDPITVEVTPESTTVENIDQKVMFVERANKKRLLTKLLKEDDTTRSIVFTRTKHGANRLVKQLGQGGVTAVAIHGNKTQNARRKALDGFSRGKVPVLVATDIASRGIDVDFVSHVFNYDLPNEPETYVHRIGRTGRAGRGGVAISFCDETEGGYLRDIERTIAMPVPMVEEHDFHFPQAVPEKSATSAKKRKRGKSTGGRQGQGQGPGRNQSTNKPKTSANKRRRGPGGPGKSRAGETGGGDGPKRSRSHASNKGKKRSGATSPSGSTTRKPGGRPASKSGATSGSGRQQRRQVDDKQQGSSSAPN